MKKNILLLAAFALLAAPASAAVRVRPSAASSPAGTVPSNVNYQGRLVDNGFPVTGLKSVTFRLYDSLTNGTLLQTIGPQIVSVSQGLFSTTIAMSTSALAGPAQKFLEVEIGSQKLSPREPLNSVPFALVAKSLEENLDISTVSVGAQLISSGTLAVASIQALTGNSYFSIISPVHMSSATLILDGSAATSLTATGNVGIGTSNPGAKLNVSSGTVVVDGSAATALALDNSGGLPVLRFREAGADKGAIKSVSGSLVLDGDAAGSRSLLLNTNSTGNVGVGAAVPGAKLDVDGDAHFGNPGTKSAFGTTGALTMASGASAVLSGANGFVTSASSVNASAFFGNGANVTNVAAVSVPASGVTAGNFQSAAYNFPTSLGVGTLTPATKLDVVGSAQFGSGAPKSTFTAAGVLQLASPLSTTYGGTGQNFGAAGINTVPFFSAAGTMGTIAAGANATVLRVPTAGGAPAFGAVDLSQTNATVNQLLTSRGGTGQDWSGIAQGAVPYFSGAGTMNTLAAGTAGQVLQTNGAGLNPTWASPSVGGATTLTAGKIWVGAAVTNIATERTVSGDITLSNTGVAAVVNLPSISGANLTSLTATNISAGTAGINVSGNAATATAVAGGAANQIPYQSGAGATTFVAAPGANMVLVGNGGAPSWTNTPTFTGTNISGTAASLSIGGNAATATSATSATTAGTATIATGFTSAALATLQATTPTALGQVYYCNNCTTTAVCISTGTTAAGMFSSFASRTTACQ